MMMAGAMKTLLVLVSSSVAHDTIDHQSSSSSTRPLTASINNHLSAVHVSHLRCQHTTPVNWELLLSTPLIQLIVMPDSSKFRIRSIRSAEEQQLHHDACQLIRRGAWEVAFCHIYSLEEIADCFEGRTSESRTWPDLNAAGDTMMETLVCEDSTSGEICGYAKWGWANGKSEGELRSLYIPPSHWKRGIGSILWDRVVECAKQQHVRSLDIWVLQRAKSGDFYTARLGQGGCIVEKINEGDYYVGSHRETALCLRWSSPT
jgi:GNAT superfamily N-acetyltransferase